jgi:hypothetical protein
LGQAPASHESRRVLKIRTALPAGAFWTLGMPGECHHGLSERLGE